MTNKVIIFLFPTKLDKNIFYTSFGDYMIIEKLLLLGICLFLPISLYFNYSTYVKTLELKENAIILEFTLIISLLLMLKYDYSKDIYSLIIYLIPIIISIFKRNIKLSIILLIIIIFLNNIEFTIINYLLLFQTLFIASIYIYLILYLFKINSTIIDLSKIQKELEREKLLRSSISKLTHELKNPIAVCNGYLEMLNINDKEKTEKYLEIITNEITRSKTIIDEFSSYGKLKEINQEELDITYLLEETVELLKPLFKQHKATIKLLIKEEIYIYGDYNKLKQVFINLLKNTIEAKKEQVPLEVLLNLKQTQNNVQIIIKDNGIGMSKEILSRVSEVFFTTKQNGTGIGLAFSKEVIELHKGSLQITSKKDHGTQITISLPKEKKSEDFNNKNY